MEKFRQHEYSIDRKLEEEVEKCVNEYFRLGEEPKRIADEVYQAVLNRLLEKK